MIELITQSAAETEAFGGTLAGLLRPGDVVLLRGELGSGKTTLVRGACRSLGIEEPVTSPTFTIGHLYHGTATVAHLDLYRFVGLSAAEWGDLEPYFDGTIAFVEWPEAGLDALPARAARPRARARRARRAADLGRRRRRNAARRSCAC